MAENELIVAEKLDPKPMFLEGKGVDEVLVSIREKAFSFGQDVSTDEGRATVKSVAHNISRSKTFLDNMGKKLVEEQQKIVKACSGNRTKVKKYLDDLKKEYRAPLTEWEAEEEKREEAEAKALQEKIGIRMNELAGLNSPLPYQEVATMEDDDFHTVLTAAKMAWEDEQARIAEEKEAEAKRQSEIDAKNKAEAERLAKIQKEQEEAQAKLAADQAKVDAEKAEIQKEKDRRAEKEKAEREAAEAAEREKKEAAEKKEAEAAEKEKLENAQYGGSERKDHLFKLADAFFENLEIDDCEYGGIGLNSKRPFGNSYVEGDILEIVGIEPVVVEQPSGGYEKEHNKAQEDYANDLYGSLIPFLQEQWKELRK